MKKEEENKKTDIKDEKKKSDVKEYRGKSKFIIPSYHRSIIK